MTSNLVETHIACPECPSSDAYCTYDDGHGYCFSCGYHTNGEHTFEDIKYSFQYIDDRAINKHSFAHYEAKTKIDADGKPVAIGFKYSNGAMKVRRLDIKQFYTQGPIADAGLFGRDKFAAGSHKYVTITEGEYDAISFYQVLRAPVVSVQSSSSARRDCSRDRSWLNSFERIYIAFDNDVAGREAAAEVAKLFDYNKVYLVKFSNRKDANEYLQAGEADELRNIWWNSKKYLPETIVSSFKEFGEILSEAPKMGVPYPFPTLTEMTYGIRTGESVLITAQEGVGKTEIMHAIEHRLLKETNDAIGAIFLEEPKRRHLQAIAGIELKRPVHLPDCGASVSDLVSAIQDVVVQDERLHVYSHFGSDDPEVILDTIRFLVSARDCRYILLDHVSMVVSGLAGEDERRALDYLATRLEMMVKELDFALIMVSHVNDLGQTRGSRYISKIADIRIDAERDLKSEDDRTKRTTFLTIAKNRYCGKTGAAGAIMFDPDLYTLTEMEDGVRSSLQS